MRNAIILFSCLLATMPAAAEPKVTAIAGSLRKDSYNKKLLEQAAKVARQMGSTVSVLDLKEYPMPFYDGDLESSKGMPDMAKKFRQALIESDLLIISSPEYNGSVSAVLKNAIDWASRNEQGKPSYEAFKGKKFAILSASPGKMGGATGLNHLRSILEGLGGIVIEKQVSIPNAHSYYEGSKVLDLSPIKEEIRELLQSAAPAHLE